MYPSNILCFGEQYDRRPALFFSSPRTTTTTSQNCLTDKDIFRQDPAFFNFLEEHFCCLSLALFFCVCLECQELHILNEINRSSRFTIYFFDTMAKSKNFFASHRNISLSHKEHSSAFLRLGTNAA